MNGERVAHAVTTEPTRAPSDALLAWYRIDRSRSMRGTLLTGAASMATGSLVIGISYLTRQPYALRVAAAVVGFACVVFGPLFTIFGLRRELAEDLYVGIRKSGLELHLEGTPRVLAWSEIERVRHDARASDGGEIVFVLRSGETFAVEHAFAGVSRGELAKKLDDYRRKSDFGLLRG